MPTYTFRIGEAFPASDPVARFITVLAMMSNDWLRLFELMRAPPSAGSDADEEAGVDVMLFRQQAALHQEAAMFIGDTRRRFSEVDRFIKTLPRPAQEGCERVVGGIDPTSPHYHDWLAGHRNITFHYPELHAEKAMHGKEEIANALARAGKLSGAITHEKSFGSVRFRFADQVAVQLLPSAPEKVQSLARAMNTLAGFVQHAARSYLDAHPPDTFTVH